MPAPSWARTSRSAAYALIGARRAHRRRHAHRPALRDRRPHHDRPRQPHLPVLLDRRARRRTRSTPASRRAWRSATATPSASSAPSTSARCRTSASRASATTTGSWPTCTSRTTARSAATPSWPTRRSWPAMCTLGDWVILGGLSGRASVRARRRARDDRLPDARCRRTCRRSSRSSGNPAEAQGINAEGPAGGAASRAERIDVVKQMHRLLYRERPDAGRGARSRSSALRGAAPTAPMRTSR